MNELYGVQRAEWFQRFSLIKPACHAPQVQQ